MSDAGITITWMGGVKTLKPIEYHITEKAKGPWWWRRIEYWIECEYSRLGPFDARHEAEKILAYAGERAVADGQS